MDAERIGELLMEKFEQVAIDRSKSSTWIYKKLKTFDFHGEAVMPKPHAFSETAEILRSVGTLAEVDSERGRLVLVTTSGLMNMNPAVVELSVSGGAVYADAHAKEGLVKQHTAEKAVERVFEALAKSETSV